jgi:uncharacterized phage protein gp47/JayE
VTTYGVTPAGFVIKPQTAIYAAVVAKLKAAPAWGPDIDYSTNSPIGQMINALLDNPAELWELGATLYANDDPEAAVGVPLDNLSSISGTTRPDESFSVAKNVLLNLDAGATVTAGSLVSPAGRPDVFFELDADVTNTGGSAADVPGNFTCSVAGPVNVAAGQLTVIATPLSGWNSVTNPTDVVPGRDVASNQELRALRTTELFTRGSATVGAIKAAATEVSGVLSASVLENTGDTADSNGLPPHSFVAIVDDGAVPAAADNDIALAIIENRAAGIPSDGSQSGTANDDSGDAHTEHFERVTRRNVYIDCTLTVNASTFPSDGLAQVQAQIVARGNGLAVAEDVIALYIRAAAFNVAGVVDVPTFTLKIGTAPGPTDTSNLPIGTYERSSWDTSRVVVALA